MSLTEMMRVYNATRYQSSGSEHAQKEIRDIAQRMIDLVSEIPDNPFKHTLAIWKKTL